MKILGARRWMVNSIVIVFVATVAVGPGDAATSAYVNENEWYGFISCGVGSVLVSAALCTLAGQTEEFRVVFPVDPGLETLVVALDWSPTYPFTGQALEIVLEPAHAGFGSPAYYATYGPPPVEFRVDDVPGDVEELQFRVFAAGEAAGIALKQPFTVYHHHFHGAPAPDGYSALP